MHYTLHITSFQSTLYVPSPQVWMLAEAAWSAQKHHEVSPTVPVQKGFGLGTTKGAPVV